MVLLHGSCIPCRRFCISQSFSSPFPFSAHHGGASQGRRPCRSLSLSLMRSAFTNPGRNKNVLAISLFALFRATEGRGLCSFASLQTNASNRPPSSKRKGLFSEGLPPPFPEIFGSKHFDLLWAQARSERAILTKAGERTSNALKALFCPASSKDTTALYTNSAYLRLWSGLITLQTGRCTNSDLWICPPIRRKGKGQRPPERL